MEDIYDPDFVEDLFDNMSGSYDRMNTITSFGFSTRWRNQFLKDIELEKATLVVDLMTGMGECWPNLIKKMPSSTKIIGIDLSDGMLRHAYQQQKKFSDSDIEVYKMNIFENHLPAASASHVVSGFGLKTFNEEQIYNLALETKRLLKDGGYFSFIDISVPQNRFLRFFYMLYLKRIIPFLGRVFLGNPENYKMLGTYTEKFQNAKEVVKIFNKAGLETNYISYFYGCASGISGRKLK